MEGLCSRIGKETMNFTILSTEFNKELSSNVTPKYKIIIDNGIEYLITPEGKKYAIWALLDFIK